MCAIAILPAHAGKDAQLAIFIGVVAQHHMPDVVQMAIPVVDEVSVGRAVLCVVRASPDRFRQQFFELLRIDFACIRKADVRSA